MPVVVVIGSGPIPAAVLAFQCSMGPAITRILPTNDNALTSEAGRPHFVGANFGDARFKRSDGRRRGGALHRYLFLRRQ